MNGLAWFREKHTGGPPKAGNGTGNGKVYGSLWHPLVLDGKQLPQAGDAECFGNCVDIPLEDFHEIVLPIKSRLPIKKRLEIKRRLPIKSKNKVSSNKTCI